MISCGKCAFYPAFERGAMFKYGSTISILLHSVSVGIVIFTARIMLESVQRLSKPLIYCNYNHQLLIIDIMHTTASEPPSLNVTNMTLLSSSDTSNE